MRQGRQACATLKGAHHRAHRGWSLHTHGLRTRTAVRRPGPTAKAPTCLASLVEAEAYDTGGGSHQAGSEKPPEAAPPAAASAAAAVRPTAASCVSRSNSSSCNVNGQRE